MPHFVYLLQCADDTFYVGQTTDLQSRESLHNSGQGGSHTAARLPVKLFYSEECDSLFSAMSREKQIKRWTTAKKAALASGQAEALRKLSRRRRY